MQAGNRKEEATHGVTPLSKIGRNVVCVGAIVASIRQGNNMCVWGARGAHHSVEESNISESSVPVVLNSTQRNEKIVTGDRVWVATHVWQRDGVMDERSRSIRVA